MEVFDESHAFPCAVLVLFASESYSRTEALLHFHTPRWQLTGFSKYNLHKTPVHDENDQRTPEFEVRVQVRGRSGPRLRVGVRVRIGFEVSSQSWVESQDRVSVREADVTKHPQCFDQTGSALETGRA